MITDAFSRKVVGWAFEPSLHATGPVKALRQAIKQRKTKNELYHHSDRGLQYCSHEYTNLLNKHGIKISMTQNGDPGENALAERMNGILKTEFLRYWPHGNYKLAKKAVTKAIKNYNESRPHQSLQFKTPCEVHKQSIIS